MGDDVLVEGGADVHPIRGGQNLTELGLEQMSEGT